MNRPPSEDEKAAAKAQWDKGSVGFFEEMGSTDAANVFSKLPKENYFGGVAKNGQEYLEKNKTMTADDSRQLENMKKSIDAIGVINDKRQKDGGIDDRKLSVLKISDFDMAVAQANANFSAYKIGHAIVYNPPYENLSWHPEEGLDTPSKFFESSLEGWWDEEKKLFDHLRNNEKIKSRKEMDAFIDANTEALEKKFDSTAVAVGHYTNLVDDLMWKEGGESRDSQSAGYAVRPGKHGFVKSVVLNPSVRAKGLYSVEEYKRRFLDYYNDLKDVMDSKKSISKEDKAKLASLRAEIADLKSKISAQKSELAQIDKELAQIDKEIAKRKQEIEADKATKEAQDEKAFHLELEKSQLDLDNTLKSTQLKSVNEDINEIEANDKNAEEIKKLRENIANANNDLTGAKKEFDEAEADLRQKTGSKDEASNKFEAKKQELSNLNQSQGQKSVDLELRKKQSETQKAELTVLAAKQISGPAEIKAKADSVKKLEADLNAKQGQVKASQEAESKAQAALDSLKEKNKSYTDALDALEKAKAALANSTNQVKEIEEAKADLSKKLEDLKNDLAKTEAANKEALKLDANNLDSLIGNAQFVSLLGQYKTLDEKMPGLKEKLKEANDKLEPIKADYNKAKEAYDLAYKAYLEAKALYESFLAQERMTYPWYFFSSNSYAATNEKEDKKEKKENKAEESKKEEAKEKEADKEADKEAGKDKEQVEKETSKDKKAKAGVDMGDVVAGKKAKTNPSSAPKTGVTGLSIYAILAAASMAGLKASKKKKEY